MTPIEALESYSSSHPETIRELLEWPRRRFLKAFEAWTRREMVKEWNQRKLDHIAAIYGNPYIESDKIASAIQSVEESYESMKRELMTPPEVLAQIDAEIMDAPFMQASRRNQARAVEHSPNADPVVIPRVSMPGEESFRRLPV